jgi:hypothetical protein
MRARDRATEHLVRRSLLQRGVPCPAAREYYPCDGNGTVTRHYPDRRYRSGIRTEVTRCHNRGHWVPGYPYTTPKHPALPVGAVRADISPHPEAA